MSIADYDRRGFDMLFDGLNAATRRMKEAQAQLPGATVIPMKPAVDLRVQLERALTEIEDAAAMLDVHYPFTAQAKRRTAQRIRNLIEQG